MLFIATHHINQGVKVKPTGRIANTASISKTGLFAALRGLLPAQGSGAPTRIFLAVLAATLGALALTAAPALAAAPEAPVSEVQSFTATTAHLRGVLNPGSAGEDGTYEFLYQASPTTCVGSSEGKRGLSFGAQGEEVGEELTNLAPDTEYAVCLLARSLEGKETVGPAVTFTTAMAPIHVETPEVKPANPITATEVTLYGVLNPHGTRESEPGSAEFRYRQSATECEGENEKSVSATETLAGKQDEAVKAAVSELLPNTKYTFCVHAMNNAGEESLSSPETFMTGTEAPSVIATTVSHPGSAGVTVEGRIAPGGLETAYSVQYGTSTAYGSQTTPLNISPSTSSATVAVTVPLTGLQPDAEYHLRLIVTNNDGTEPGGDVTFATYPAGGTSGLPDGRVYEMVTPPENHNADVYELAEGLVSSTRLFQAAADGNAITYVAEPATGGNGSDGNGDEGNEYLASRLSQGGWSQVNITPAGSNLYTAYQAFSSDLSVGFLVAPAEVPFVTTSALAEPADNAQKSYQGLYSQAFGESLYHPLFTGKPPYRPNVLHKQPDGIEVGGVGEFGSSFVHNVSEHDPLYAGSSANGEDQLFEVNDALLAGEGPPELERELDENVKQEVKEIEEASKLYTEAGNGTDLAEESKREEARQLVVLGERDELYESVDGRLSLVNVLPDGKLAPGATFGGQQDGWIDYDPEPDFSRDISADGSRVFWTALEPTVADDTEDGGGYLEEELRPGRVYVREGGTSTVAVSQGPAEFWTASSDGKYAFYTEAGKLWRFDVEDQTRTELAGAGSDVAGVIGTNETGEAGGYVYFVAGGVLASNANSGGEVATARACERSQPYIASKFIEPGEPVYEELHGRLPAGYGCNVYVSHGGETRFIATLGAAGDGNDWAPQLGARTSNITPAGQGLVFSARENLTGAPYGDEGSEEAYVYDASEGSLFCASCRPQASGSHLPSSSSLVYTYRRISEDGDRVFFDSEAPLVARDVNGQQDVYEWERDGSGGCTETDGCVYLLSGGIEGDAFLVDTSVSGNDVFFVARQKLVPEANEDANLYDARVDGVLPVAPSECSGTGCQGVPAPAPTFATPASVTFSGVGNFPPPAVVKAKAKSKPAKCKKHYVKNKQGRCVKSQVKKKAKARKASDDRRASR